jgi:hypothetical protein
MYLGPLPLFAWGGILLFVMTTFQVLIGTRVIKVDSKYHRINGFLILAFGLIHGVLALLYFLG